MASDSRSKAIRKVQHKTIFYVEKWGRWKNHQSRSSFETYIKSNNHLRYQAMWKKNKQASRIVQNLKNVIVPIIASGQSEPCSLLFFIFIFFSPLCVYVFLSLFYTRVYRVRIRCTLEM